MATDLETPSLSQPTLGSPNPSGAVNAVTEAGGDSRGGDYSANLTVEGDAGEQGTKRFPVAGNGGQRSKAKPEMAVKRESEQEHDSDSDFVLEDIDESEDAETEGDKGDSDYSGADGAKRRKKQGGKKSRKGARDDRRRERPDNEMTRKLRSQRKQVESDAEYEDEEIPTVGDKIEEKKQEAIAVPEASRGARDVAKELQNIQGMWEMAEILEFLHVFKSILQMPTIFSADALEEAIVQSPGPGLLASIHMGLLRGISPRSQINEETWTVYLASKLLAQHIREGKRAELHFAPQKGHEMEEYAALSSTNRVGALKALCEMRGDREDVRSLIETVLKPKKAREQQKGKLKGGQNGVIHHTIDDFRRVPYGEGSNGERYWLLDMWGSCGIRMYKETLAEMPAASLTPAPHTHTTSKTRGRGRGRGGRGRGGGRRGRAKKPLVPILGGSMVSEGPPSGTWEVAASSLTELESLGEDLIGTRKRKCAALSKRIFNEIIPELQNRELAEERKRKQAEKLRVNLGNVILDTDGGYGRSRRKRKEISYRFDEYDRMIDEGINASDVQELDFVETLPVRPAVEPERNLADLDMDAVQKGFRRGRSVAGILGSEATDEESMMKEDSELDSGENGVGGGGGVDDMDGVAEEGEPNGSIHINSTEKQPPNPNEAIIGPSGADGGGPHTSFQPTSTASRHAEEDGANAEYEEFSQPLKKRRAYLEGFLEDPEIKQNGSDGGGTSKKENWSDGEPDYLPARSENDASDDDMMGGSDIEAE
ncbi:hypothetical protein BSKO_03028 [Bryopsis sp. KO-2023]|nr:hypothetical protein BSKO_03028 [Bryopsis sp. KO-2023]